jgi:fructose-specific phosphotransferase system IIA component
VLLTELLSPERIRVPLQALDKETLLDELIAILNGNDQVEDLRAVSRAVRDREEVLSTGIGNGVAIPHGKSPGVSSLVLAAGVTAEPVDFEALDGQPVRLVFLLVGPEAAAGQHVKVLSRISRLLRRESFRNRLIDAASAEEFYDILAEAEAS